MSAAGSGSGGPLRPLPPLPEPLARRFAGYDTEALREPGQRAFVLARLLEEGDGGQLRWLVAAVGVEPLADLVAQRGGRLLSRRGRAFWACALGVESAPSHPLAAALWPLA